MCQLTYLILSSQLTHLLYYTINETTQNLLNANYISWRHWPIGEVEQKEIQTTQQRSATVDLASTFSSTAMICSSVYLLASIESLMVSLASPRNSNHIWPGFREKGQLSIDGGCCAIYTAINDGAIGVAAFLLFFLGNYQKPGS
jgi:hypothetical protein